MANAKPVLTDQISVDDLLGLLPAVNDWHREVVRDQWATAPDETMAVVDLIRDLDPLNEVEELLVAASFGSPYHAARRELYYAIASDFAYWDANEMEVEEVEAQTDPSKRAATIQRHVRSHQCAVAAHLEQMRRLQALASEVQ